MAANYLDSVPSENQRSQEIWSRIYVKKYYRAIEVLSHRQPNDFWIILFERILDLTEIMKTVNQLTVDDENYKAMRVLLELGGIEIGQLCTPQNMRMGVFGLKSFSAYGIANDLYWWNDPSYVIGMLTTRERKVMVVDKNNGEVFRGYVICCEEDTVYQIQEKYCAQYSLANHHNHTWYNLCGSFRQMHLDKTLTENGIEYNPDEDITFIWSFHRYTRTNWP